MTIYEINVLRSELERIAEASAALEVSFRELKALTDEAAKRMEEATSLLMAPSKSSVCSVR